MKSKIRGKTMPTFYIKSYCLIGLIIFNFFFSPSVALATVINGLTSNVNKDFTGNAASVEITPLSHVCIWWCYL